MAQMVWICLDLFKVMGVSKRLPAALVDGREQTDEVQLGAAAHAVLKLPAKTSPQETHTGRLR